jgi:hypothetical protein
MAAVRRKVLAPIFVTIVNLQDDVREYDEENTS